MEKLASQVVSQAIQAVPDKPAKNLYLCRPPSIESLPSEINPSSSNFGLLLAMDASCVLVADLASVADTLIAKGLAYLCAWGPECERVHDVFDESISGVPRAAGLDELDVIVTTWHADEPLAEALWFFINCAFATKGYEQNCKDWVIAVIGNPSWEAIIRSNIAVGS